MSAPADDRILSKNLLKMKFMARKQEEELRRRLEAEEEKKIDESHWHIVETETDATNATAVAHLVEVEDSLLRCEEGDVTGRRSYRHFNDEVEKMYAEQNQSEAVAGADAYDKHTGVSEAEMTARYTTYVGMRGPKSKGGGAGGGKRKGGNASEAGASERPKKKQRR